MPQLAEVFGFSENQCKWYLPMLKAMLHGKTKGTGAEGVRLSEFVGAEDLLTATVFERILYLPDEMVGTILFAGQIWGKVSLPKAVESCWFWPWWEAPAPGEEAPHEKAATEPDVVIEFSDRILVIEAKRYDTVDQQQPSQLAREYFRARGRFTKPVWLLAVGGLPDGRSTTKVRLRDSVLYELAHITRNTVGSDMRFAVVAWCDLFQIISKAINGSPAHKRLIADIREGLLLHAVNPDPPSWLEDLALSQHTMREIQTSATFFVPSLAAMLSSFGTISSSSIGEFLLQET